MAIALAGYARKDFTVHQADFSSCLGHGLPPLDGTTTDWMVFAMVLTEDFVLYIHGGQTSGAPFTGQLNITNITHTRSYMPIYMHMPATLENYGKLIKDPCYNLTGEMKKLDLKERPLAWTTMTATTMTRGNHDVFYFKKKDFYPWKVGLQHPHV